MSRLGGVNGTVCNVQQYQQSLASETSPDPTITCLTHGQTIGLTLIAETSFLSLLCVMVLFILIGRNVLRYRKVLPNGGWRLLQTPADIYLLTLFIFNIIMALGGVLNVRWAHNGIVTTGSYCTAQGIIQQSGELGVALTILLLGTHTFVTALWSVGIEARRPAFGLVGLICVFIALWVGLGNGLNKKYETPTPYWCFISHRYFAERLSGSYIWIWIALFASIVLYIPVYFWATGRLLVNNRSLNRSQLGTPNRRATLRLLLLPLAYLLSILPLTATHWWAHQSVPSAVLFFNASMLNLSGAFEVVLFLFSQTQLLLFAPPVFEPELPQLSAVDLANDSQELCSCQLSKRSRNTMVQSGEDSSQGLHDVI
ncbi:hypothetical protein BGW80DRAFT_1455547 [Lactifluus volemus]|nr:hypothetical protein BGW80DRAFT_1455547 [Lactifluus volemus]